MASDSVKWTDQQKQAIAAWGRDVLVTASAGTGKTAVLSERCVDIMRSGRFEGDVLNMLVVTFTDMAAEQMKRRIAEAIRQQLKKREDGNLRRQLVLLQGADISTIHAFCKRLITERFYRLGLDPAFSVMDGDEAGLLKSEVLEDTIEWAWRQEELRPGLVQLLSRRNLASGDGFVSSVIELNDFLDGVVSRRRWYDKALAFAAAGARMDTEPAQRQKRILRSTLHEILARIGHAVSLYSEYGGGGKWLRLWQEPFIEPVSGFLKTLECGDWEGFARALRRFEKPARFGLTPDGVQGAVKDVIKALSEETKRAFLSLSDLALLDEHYGDVVAGPAAVQTTVLVELVRRFHLSYAAAKRKLNCLDFADLEHYALKLLSVESEGGVDLQPSETAMMLRQRYKCIFVDEYQDINPVQKAILQMLSSGGNVFFVGDVKQSIYAFRGAEPGIFVEDLGRAGVDEAAENLRVDLNMNFRSAAGILEFVNEVFSRTMTRQLSSIDYDESARLRAGLEQSGGSEPVVEMHLIDEQPDEDDGKDEDVPVELDVITARQRQAAVIARRIRKMVGAETGKAEFQVFDKEPGRLRDVEYRDIVVLMRSLAVKANDYVEVLRLAGVPVSCEAAAGYFEETEIRDMLSLLKVLDNPRRDIELAAVLRGPFFKIEDTEFARIKLQARKMQVGDAQKGGDGFYGCVEKYIESGEDDVLAGKLSAAFDQLERWRTLARRGSLADLIWHIYRQTHLIAFVAAMPNGQARRANLLKLHDRAIQFEGFAGTTGVASLSRFVEFVEKMQAGGRDWSSAEPEAAAGNAVRIMSVHKSKGLEFPVVFVAELDAQFNNRDSTAECVADAENTVGLKIIDDESNAKMPTLAHQVIAEEKRSKALAEEMRILYVALTRARDRLILAASAKGDKVRRVLCNGILFPGQRIPHWQLKSCRTGIEWVLYGLSRQHRLHEAFETGLSGRADDDRLFDLAVYGGEEIDALSGYVTGLREGSSDQAGPDRTEESPERICEVLSQVKQKLRCDYDYGDAPHQPAKQSVTELTHAGDEYARGDFSGALRRLPEVVSGEESASGRGESMLVGTAAHAVLAEVELSQAVTADEVRLTLENLIARGDIAERIATKVDVDAVTAFFDSELGKMAVEADACDVLREWEFTYGLPVGGSGPEDKVVVQGMIDLLIRTDEGLIVVDFKTDDVNAEGAAERANSYREQLKHYGTAACSILGANRCRRYVYFLKPGLAIAVD